jgi:type VII secretion-associated serine protease mycosin
MRGGVRLARRAAVLVTAALVMVVPPSGAHAQSASSPVPIPTASGDSVGSPDPATVVVRFDPDVTERGAESAAASMGLHVVEPIGATGHVLVSTEGKAPDQVVQRLRADPRVAEAEPNHQLRAAVEPDDPRYLTQQPYLANIGMPSAWDRGQGSPTALIAIVDTGVDLDHPDLAGRIAPGWDFVGDDPVADDDSGHGTMVAGAAAAGTNNGKGVAGVAWNARILPVKVLDSQGSGTDADVASGITWAADQGARVINVSAGGTDDSSVLRDAVDYALARDAVVVAAAGNDASAFPFYPAAYPGVVAVTATDHAGAFASFSNYGPWMTLSAPGVNITSTAMGPGEQYSTGSGTSFASPLVAGASALLRAANPTWSQAEVMARLKVTARDAGPPGPDDQYGYGLVDPTYALGGAPRPALTSPSYGEYHALVPARILDTRDGTGGTSGPVGPGQTIVPRMTGNGGVPSTGVSAVVVNVTATRPTGESFLTAYPADSPRPLASNLNFVGGQTVPNLVHVKLDPNGYVALYNQAGSTHVLADVLGWYSDVSGARGSRFSSLPPTRVLDTRNPPERSVGPGQDRGLVVTGRGGVPSTGVSAVVLNVTATRPTAEGYLTVHPTGSQPYASNLNFLPGQTVPNLAIAKVGLDALGQGSVSFFNSTGNVHVIADVVGWYGAEPGGAGARFRPASPVRIFDTRTGVGGTSGAVGQQQSVGARVTGVGGVPEERVPAVVMNVTATRPTAEGYLTIYPAGSPVPNASNLNFLPGQTVPNLAIAKVGLDHRVGAYNAAGSTFVIFDALGWFTE